MVAGCLCASRSVTRALSVLWSLVWVGLLLASGCAEELGDIDRTQANYFKKSDLDGTWYYLQTIIAVPPTSAYSFMGETSSLEKIRWRIQEKYLVGYRAYPKVPGAERPSGAPPEFYGEDYTENPVVAFGIEKHFDRMREYNSNTGEQSNVIAENDTERPWHERDYVRVDWSKNLVTNFEFLAEGSTVTNLQYFVTEEQGGDDALYRERDAEDQLAYFDFVGKLFVEPSEEGCWWTWAGWAAEDCTAGEVKVRYSFGRTPAEPDYEPYQYDDNLMSKFGYFRSERVTYDPERGLTDAGRRYLINRHNIWTSSYQRDAAGEFQRDPRTGERIPIPVSRRSVRTIPYYLSATFPADPLLEQAAQESIAAWNEAARDGVAALQGTRPTTPIFVLCHNPVQAGDHAACGGPGFQARFGDLRYSALHWVEPYQIEELLGYGPPNADPVTGEIISGKAHVYGTAVDTYATHALDVIRFLNEDLPAEELILGTHFTDALWDRLERVLDPGRLAPALKQAPLQPPPTASAATRAAPAQATRKARPGSKVVRPDSPARPANPGTARAQRQARRQELKARGFPPYNPAAAESRYQALLDAGLGGRFQNEELRALVAGQLGRQPGELTAAELEAHDPGAWLNPFRLEELRRRHRKALAHNVEFTDFLQTSALGIARRYEGRTDYDQIWRELRALIFRATAIHELGHTVGLRHNFQGSYDSLNYFDAYWDLRQENLGDAPSACCPRCAVANCRENEYCVCETGECRLAGGKQCEIECREGEAPPCMRECAQGQICDGVLGGCVDYPQGALTYQDLYTINGLTKSQLEGQMRDYQYSSIMDYGYSFHADLMGLGKYDRAAIAFGYGCGADFLDHYDPRCRAPGALPASGGAQCLAPRPGPVEVFAKPRQQLGQAADLLTQTETHFDHTVRFDDSNIPIVNLLERCHYTSVARAFPTLTDLRARSWMRYDEYLAQRPVADGADPAAIAQAGEWIRVPYAFCSDEYAEYMLSCQLWDQGADPFEMTRTHADHWRTFYYFDNFRRNRFGWEPWRVLESSYYRDFLPLSDYYQFWFFAEDSYDPVFDQYFEMAAYTGFNLLGEVLATPPYGPTCQGRDGTLVPETDDPSRKDRGEYIRKAYCENDTTVAELLPGDGRRRHSRFAFDTGYYSFDRALEAGHWWTTTAAIWALTDPDASVIGVDADWGTYAITFYDMFPDELSRITAGILAERYDLYAPLTYLGEDADRNGVAEGRVVQRPAAPYAVWDPVAANWSDPFNPETGEPIPELPGVATQALCESCTADSQCLGSTGEYGGVFCQPLAEGEPDRYCLQDCWEDEDLCRPGETCDDFGNCVPTDGKCKVRACSRVNPYGACDEGLVCQEGVCQPQPLLTRTDPTLMLADDILFWGLAMSSMGYELRINDSYRVFRIGSQEQELPDGDTFELVTFTDPIGGQVYGALTPRCGQGAVQGGPVGLCSPCEQHEDCNGYLGMFYGGTFCVDGIVPQGQVCLQDCGDGTEDACPAGTTCGEGDDGELYCLPPRATCVGQTAACAADHPRGDCAVGFTCVEGECVEQFVPSPRCQIFDLPDSPAVVLVKRGQELAARYNETLEAYYAYSGEDPVLDDQLFWEYWGTRWQLDALMVNLNLLRTYMNYLGYLF